MDQVVGRALKAFESQVASHVNGTLTLSSGALAASDKSYR
jgi:hypothetical protein